MHFFPDIKNTLSLYYVLHNISWYTVQMNLKLQTEINIGILFVTDEFNLQIKKIRNDFPYCAVLKKT